MLNTDIDQVDALSPHLPECSQNTSIFSFYHNVFKRFLSQGHSKSALCGKELNFVNKVVENIFGKGKNVAFSLCSYCFQKLVTLSQTSPGFYVSAVQIF